MLFFFYFPSHHSLPSISFCKTILAWPPLIDLVLEKALYIPVQQSCPILFLFIPPLGGSDSNLLVAKVVDSFLFLLLDEWWLTFHASSSPPQLKWLLRCRVMSWASFYWPEVCESPANGLDCFLSLIVREEALVYLVVCRGRRMLLIASRGNIKFWGLWRKKNLFQKEMKWKGRTSSSIQILLSHLTGASFLKYQAVETVLLPVKERVWFLSFFLTYVLRKISP